VGGNFWSKSIPRRFRTLVINQTEDNGDLKKITVFSNPNNKLMAWEQVWYVMFYTFIGLHEHLFGLLTIESSVCNLGMRAVGNFIFMITSLATLNGRRRDLSFLLIMNCFEM
jgi:hypothetical protein